MFQRKLIGVEHVGLGGDFDGCKNLAAGLHDVGQYQVSSFKLQTT